MIVEIYMRTTENLESIYAVRPMKTQDKWRWDRALVFSQTIANISVPPPPAPRPLEEPIEVRAPTHRRWWGRWRNDR